MKNKKILLGIVLIFALLVIFFMNHSNNSSIDIHIDSIEEIQAMAPLDVFSEEGEKTYLKVKLAITNHSNEDMVYSVSRIITSSKDEISEEWLSVDSDDTIPAYSTIKPKETLTGYCYFQTPYEKNMKLKAVILYNLETNGDEINGDTQEYLIDLKK